jgi:hypothetical protein
MTLDSLNPRFAFFPTLMDGFRLLHALFSLGAGRNNSS